MKRELKINQDVMNAILPPPPEDMMADTRAFIQSLPYREKEIKVKRKVPVSIILAMVFALLAVTALAATILSRKQFVDQVLAPKAQENDSDMFTPEEIREIISIAENMGITLDEKDIRRYQRSEEGYYKEELLRDVLRAELGFYPRSWSIEDQYWYSQMLIACGLEDTMRGVLPEGDEISQEQALALAADYIHTNYDPAADLENKGLYRRMQSYQEYYENEYRKGRMWYFYYEALDAYHDSYEITLWSDGTVDECTRIPGLNPEEVPQVYEVENLYARQYSDGVGGYSNWTEETFMAFQADLQAAIAAHGYNDTVKSVRMLMLQEYAPADESRVTRRQAIDIALQKAGWEEIDLIHCYCLYLPGRNANYWKVSMLYPGTLKYVEINAETGEAGELLPQKEDESRWRFAVLEENLPEDVNYHRETNKYVNRWGSDALPQEVWDQLNALGLNDETAGELYEKWCAQYGFDTDFWPDAEFAAYTLRWDILADSRQLPGLPLAGDISGSQAIERVRQSGKAAAALLSGHPAAHLWYNILGEGSRVWEVIFYDTSASEKRVVSTWYVDAPTGEVLDAGELSNRQNEASDWQEPRQVEPADVPGAMSREEAQKLADKTMRSVCAGILTEEQMSALRSQATLYDHLIDADTPVWYFVFYRPDRSPAEHDVLIYFNAVTGEILNADYTPAEQGNG